MATGVLVCVGGQRDPRAPRTRSSSQLRLWRQHVVFLISCVEIVSNRFWEHCEGTCQRNPFCPNPWWKSMGLNMNKFYGGWFRVKLMQSTQATKIWNWHKFHINCSGERSCNGECQRGALHFDGEGNSLNLAQLSSHEIYWYGMILNMCFMSWIDICCAWKLQTSHSELSTCLAALCWAHTCPKVGTPWYTMIHLYIAEKVRAMTTPSIYSYQVAATSIVQTGFIPTIWHSYTQRASGDPSRCQALILNFPEASWPPPEAFEDGYGLNAESVWITAFSFSDRKIIGMYLQIDIGTIL